MVDLGSTGFPRGSLRNRLHQIGQPPPQEEDDEWFDNTWEEVDLPIFQEPTKRSRRITNEELTTMSTKKKQKPSAVDLIPAVVSDHRTREVLEGVQEGSTRPSKEAKKEQPQQQQAVRQIVEVLKDADKEKRLLELIGEYKGQILLLTNTKTSCEKLGLLLAEKGHKCEFIHNALLREKKDSVLAAFREQRCRILVATHPNLQIGNQIDLMISFDFPEEGITYYVARVAKAQEISARIMVSFFKEADGRNANALIRVLRMANQLVPTALEQLDRGEFGSLSKSEMRQGKAREVDLPSLIVQKPEVIILDPSVQDAPCRGDAKLSFIFLVSGPPHDRISNDCFSSWVLPDHGFRQRRDGLARCILASMWGRPPWQGQGKGECALPRVLTDCECFLIFDQVAPTEEGKAAVVRIESDFVRAVGKLSADECTVLLLLDKAIRGVVAVPGVTVAPSFTSVAAAAHYVFRNVPTKKSLVMELHDSLEQQLPVYGITNMKKKTKLSHVVVVLGCVDDHIDNVNTVLATANELGLARSRVNLGPRSEMSSKVVDIIQSHHCAGRLLPALRILNKTQRLEISSSSGGEAKGVCGRVAGLCVLNLHFWVFVPGVQISHLPTAVQCREINPVLTTSHRPFVWRLSSLVLSAIAKSHGAYDRDPSIRLSFVLADGRVVTLGAELIQKHLGDRKWGALTEHHVLVGIRDALERDPHCLHEDFERALKHWGGGNERALVVIPSDAPTAPFYEAASVCESKKHPSRLHIVFPNQQDGPLLSTLSKRIPTVTCQLPEDCWNQGRCISALQCHNNCGRLCYATDSLFSK